MLAQSFLHEIWFHESNTKLAEDSDNLFMFILWLSIISFIGLMWATIYWAFFKYRRKAGVPAQRSPSHNTVLELSWSIIPLIPLVVIFFWGFKGYMAQAAPPAGAEEITIRGFKWGWDVTYDNGAKPGESAPYGTAGEEVPVLVVPAGKPVRLKMYSSDVIHSFYVPAFRVKFDVFPNRYTEMWFQAEEVFDTEASGRPGHSVFCAEYCGDKHSQMGAFIRPVPPEDYERIKAQWAQPPTDDPIVYGEWLWKQNCRSCHSVDGSANTGPTWLNAYGYDAPLEGGGSVLIDENYIRESILMPHVKIHEGYANQMNSFAGLLDDQQIDAIIMYMKSLSDKSSVSSPNAGGDEDGGDPADESGDGAGDEANETEDPGEANDAG